MKKSLKVKGGSASRYTTRNQALNRQMLNLAHFRRLCILKGIHPRCAPPLDRNILTRSDTAHLAHSRLPTNPPTQTLSIPDPPPRAPHLHPPPHHAPEH